MSRPVIGCAHRCANPPRCHRTLESAFGPGARLDVDRKDPDRYVAWAMAACSFAIAVILLVERLS